MTVKEALILSTAGCELRSSGGHRHVNEDSQFHEKMAEIKACSEHGVGAKRLSGGVVKRDGSSQANWRTKEELQRGD